jgi:Ca-activated chloride channel family protein
MPTVWQLLLVASILLPFGGSAHRRTEEGNRHYAAEEYEAALRAYTEAQVEAPQAAELYYNIGNVLYREGDFAGAAEAYTRALLTAPESLVQGAAYNLGNARYRLGEYDEAVSAYERALLDDPSDADAKRNLELALRAERRRPGPPPEPGGDGSETGERGSGTSPRGEGEETGGAEGDAAPRSEPSNGDGDAQPPRPAGPRPGEMSAEEAARMLDGAEEQELENLRDHALRRRPRRGRTPEEDW